MSNHRTKREVAKDRAALIAERTTVIRRYTLEGTSLAALSRDYSVGTEWLRQQLDTWNVPRRTRHIASRASQPVHETEHAVLAERLAHPSLLDASIVVDLSTARRHSSSPLTRLAVPVGYERMAGQITVANWAEALLTILQLEELGSRFPSVRQRKPLASPSESRTVCWGASTPADDACVRGRMFGYHDAGIAAYIADPAPLNRLPSD
jgi:hypothetical protein